MSKVVVAILALILFNCVYAQTTGNWFADPKSGCRIWDDTPQPLQSIKFEGTCIKKLAHGQGKVFFYQNGVADQTWDANWVNGKAVGKLTITYDDNSKYYGELLNGKKNGQGSATYANGDKYDGEFRNGKFNGNGNFYKADGWRYSGGFDNNEMSGKGTLYYANGEKYVGDFKNSKLNGNGVYYDANNTVKASGLFENGKFIPSVTREKLETIAACYAANSIIEADFTIRGDYNGEQRSKKITKFLMDRFYFYADIYNKKMPIELAGLTYQLLNDAVKKYAYITDDNAQWNYAVGVVKSDNCRSIN